MTFDTINVCYRDSFLISPLRTGINCFLRKGQKDPRLTGNQFCSFQSTTSLPHVALLRDFHHFLTLIQHLTWEPLPLELDESDVPRYTSLCIVSFLVPFYALRWIKEGKIFYGLTGKNLWWIPERSSIESYGGVNKFKYVFKCCILVRILYKCEVS